MLNWTKNLYGTHQLFGELDDDPEAIWLPRSLDDVRRELQERAERGGHPPQVGVSASADPPGHVDDRRAASADREAVASAASGRSGRA